MRRRIMPHLVAIIGWTETRSKWKEEKHRSKIHQVYSYTIDKMQLQYTKDAANKLE